MLFVPRQVALASSSRPLPPAVAMAKEESRKEKKSKSKAAAKAGPDARAAVVASVAAFLEAAGFTRALAALLSEANLEESVWRSSAVSLEDLVSKFLESSSAASPATAVTVASTEQDKATDVAAEDAGEKKKDDDDAEAELNEADTNASAPSAVEEDGTGEKKKKKKKKGEAEASEPETTKVMEPSAEEKPAENAAIETTKEKKHKKKKKGDSSSAGEVKKETVKSVDQKVDGKKKKSKKQEGDDEVEARLEKASLAVQNKLEAAEKLKEDGGDGAGDKTRKKKKGKSAVEKSEEIDAVSVSAEADSAKEKIDGVKTVKDDDEKKAKKKRKKSDSEENFQDEGKEIAGKGSAPKSDDQGKIENGRSSSENAVVGKKRKLEDVEESKSPAAENGTANQTPINGFSEDNSNENSNLSKPTKRQKKSDEPKSVTPFQRVKLEAVKFADERLQDNSYWAKGGADSGYGAKAQEILGQVRGRGFRHEKTKKKRGTYRGGQIDLGTHSIKFDNSDDE